MPYICSLKNSTVFYAKIKFIASAAFHFLLSDHQLLHNWRSLLFVSKQMADCLIVDFYHRFWRLFIFGNFTISEKTHWQTLHHCNPCLFNFLSGRSSFLHFSSAWRFCCASDNRFRETLAETLYILKVEITAGFYSA